MTRKNLIAASLALALLAAACSSDSATDQTSASTEATEAPSETPAETSTTSDGTSNTTAEAATTTLSEAELQEIEEARNRLGTQVAQATEPWPTNWAISDIDLSELDLGIGRVDPRDAIPPVDNPNFESPTDAAAWLAPEEPGALVQLEGEAYFYALSILHRHEIVNHEIAGIPVAVTYCPLCNTALAFDRRVDGQVIRLGVSGLLRNSDMVMWDDVSVSLWQQITGEAIVGEATGQKLTPLSTAIVSFSDFAESFPNGLSMSQDTGYGIPYGANPYRGYSSSEVPFLYDGPVDARYEALSRVVGVTEGGGAKAYPFEEIEPLGAVNDSVGDVPIVVFWGGGTLDALDNETVRAGRAIGTGVAYLRTVDGQELTFTKNGETWTDAETSSTWTLLGEAIDGPLVGSRLTTAVHRNEFWFAWGAFFPSSDVFEG